MLAATIAFYVTTTFKRCPMNNVQKTFIIQRCEFTLVLRYAVTLYQPVVPSKLC